ncbi:MAG: helix-turn-helix domain-containing protein [Candidatus Pacearchaeota archaeon]|jgi:sugar-specific transcriptional regulator TrmB
MTYSESFNDKHKIVEILELIGLSKNEIIVYLDLISHNHSSALEISKRTKIHRSNTYDSIRTLIEKGFLSETIKDNKRIFNAIEPHKIKNYIKQKEHEFDLILPELTNLKQNENNPGTINISQGPFAAREALLDLLKLRNPIFVYGASKEAVETFGEGFLKEFHKERIKNKIHMKHIYNKNAQERISYLNKLKFTEARALPEKYDSSVSTNICEDFILLLIFSKPVLVIKIKNKEIAESYKKYFDLIWKSAKV